MIVYQADKRSFRADVFSNRIDDVILRAFRDHGRGGVSKAERDSWKNSLAFMDRIIEADAIPDDAGIALEMRLPQSSKRIDFVLTGLSPERRKVAIIVELKQWQTAERTDKDGIVRTILGGARRETSHPSYQAWSYAAMLEDFNEAVREVPIGLQPCAYLHNCEDGSVIRHEFYRAHLAKALVREKNVLTGKARMVAGYCWPWNSKKHPGKMDIILPGEQFEAQWNMAEDGMLWILKDHSVEQVGCIHTCQGLELDYVGVILGHDLVIRNDKWIEFPDRRDKSDRSIKGYYKLAVQDHVAAQRRAREIIRNTYRTLMTRGLKGCFIYSVDAETNEFLKRAAHRPDVAEPERELTAADALPFEFVPADQVQPYDHCAPCFPDVRVAAGAFASQLQTDDCSWVRLKEDYPCKPGYFVVKITGESMNRFIPNGAWCLFRPPPVGSRQGKILLVQHRDIQDPDTGACTVKRYTSTKRAAAEGWEHESIILSPQSNDAAFKPMTLRPTADADLRVIGEFFAVLL